MPEYVLVPVGVLFYGAAVGVGLVLLGVVFSAAYWIGRLLRRSK